MNKKTYETSLTVKAQKVKDKFPNFSITVNGKLIPNCKKTDEDTINFLFSSNFSNNLIEINFTNKDCQDTTVDNQGNILEDLAVVILQLTVDGFDLTDNLKLNCKYVDEKDNLLNTFGYMGKNGKLSYHYICPPFYFLRQNDYLES